MATDSAGAVLAFPNGLRAPQEWLDGILSRCPQATPDLVKHELLTVVRDFCMEGRAWTRWLEPVLVTPGVTRFAIEPRVDDDVPETDADVTVTAVIAVEWADDGCPLAPRDRQRSVGSGYGRHWRTGYSLFEPGIIELFDPPLVPRALRIHAVLTPNTLAVPAWLVGQHYDAICAGVLARLYAVPGSFKDTEGSIRMERKYRAARTRALIRAQDAYTAVGGTQAWAYPGFGA